MVFNEGDFESFPKDSLKKFYSAYVERLGKISEEMRKLSSYSNIIAFLSEASKKSTVFLDTQKKQSKAAFEVWTSVIKKSQDNNEIKSALDASEIAKLFVYIRNGILVYSSILPLDKSFFKTELKEKFDNLYSLLSL
jgi:hypothetical protein